MGISLVETGGFTEPVVDDEDGVVDVEDGVVDAEDGVVDLADCVVDVENGVVDVEDCVVDVENCVVDAAVDSSVVEDDTVDVVGLGKVTIQYFTKLINMKSQGKR